MQKSKCPICNYEDTNSSEQSSFCPKCGADFLSEQAEKKLKEAELSGTYTTVDKRIGGVSTPCSFYLTDKRFIAIPAKMKGYSLTGALTASVLNKMTSKSGVISIPVERIKAVRDGKFGLLQSAIIIDTIDGELLKITVPKQKEWKEAIIKSSPNVQ